MFRNKLRGLWAVCVWLCVWYVAAKLVKQEILLASPTAVIVRLTELIGEADFLKRVGSSCLHVLKGFALGCITGVVFGIAASKSRIIKELLAPAVAILRSVPVASFIILALVWINKRNLCEFIAMIICMPVFYSNTLAGMESADEKLLEMAKVFRLSALKRIKVIYLPAVLPHILAAVEVAAGLAWKSGIAAEVIALPNGSVGEKLYYAKIYLETTDLMCWTIAVVAVSAVTSALIRLAVRRFAGIYD